MLAIVQRHPLVVALCAVAGLLLLALALETATLRPSAPGLALRRGAPYEAKLLPSLAAADPERLYPEMAARPLFIPTRRPAPAAAAATAFTRGQYILQGVIVVGDNRVALLKEKTSGRIHRVEKGKELNGMKIADISPESVTLGQGSEQEVLSLQVQKVPPGIAATHEMGPFSGGPPNGVLGGPGVRAPVAGPASAVPTRPGGVQSLPLGAANARAAAVPQAASAPMTPEEVLARRRARRALQTQ